MIYKIQHGDREIKVIAGSLKTAEQWVRSHCGEPVAKVQQPEPIVEEVIEEPELDLEDDASNQD